MEKLFRLKENKTTVRTEIVAGITTFMAMAYILAVNPDMFGKIGGVEYGVMYNAAYISTAISAVFGTLLIGLMSKLPLAQAPGMGLNAFFVFTACNALGFTYANALLMVLADGLIFVLLTVTGLRRLIFEAIPRAVKTAISAGIGLFIAFLGLQNVDLVVASESTLVDLHSFNFVFGDVTWGEIMPPIVTVLALVAIAVLSKKRVRGAVFWGIIGASVLYYLLGLTIPDFEGYKLDLSLNPIAPFADFFELSFVKVFSEGFDFSAYLAANSVGSLLVTFVCTTLALCMVDMFDTIGTLYGACAAGDMFDENGEVPNMDKAMLADAVATCFGAVCGTSTVTAFVESTAGVAEGGRTGLTSVAAAAMFFIAMFLAPLASLIPSCATAAALVYVGILMIGGVRNIDWHDPTAAVPAFLTMALMPFTYNISYGIAFGLISYILIRVFTGTAHRIKLGTWVIGLLFTVMFFVSR